ncbi:MAG TPA: AraC family transcriptional regulator [Spirochaetia bacterium]|nr:AraC family transcriptional regulator [Spirochaetia bacterium]
MKNVIHAPTQRNRRTVRSAARVARSSLPEKVQRVIETSYAGAISTSSIARRLGYNADYLERVFRADRKISVTEALHQKRIGVARALLNKHPAKTVNEIAVECGYADPGYFRRVFKRVTGLTPRAFRSQACL